MKKLGLILLVAVMVVLCVSCTETEAPENAPFAVMQIGETKIAIDAEATPILSALGKETAYEESPSCAFEGMDKLYVYPGFRIKTYSMDGVDYIYSVELTDDSLATPEGISIGMESAAVSEKYGTPTKENDSSMQFGFENTVLQFIFRDGKITNIQYLKNNTNN